MSLFTKFLLLVSALFACNHINSQSYSYVPMPDSNAHWLCYTAGMADGITPEAFPYNLYLNGDTLINGTMYKAIYNETTFKYGIREDSSKKVYGISYTRDQFGYFALGDSLEHLLFDFNMQVGESFYDSAFFYRPIVQRIDTVSMFGVLRKRFYIKNQPDTTTSQYIDYSYEYWIEGVGSSQGLAETRTICNGEVCTCFSILYQNGLMTYQDTLSCHAIPSSTNIGIHEVMTNSFAISPNPATHTLYITSNQNNIHALYLSDLAGQELMEEKEINNMHTSIDLSSLSSGIYLITIKDSEGNMITKKLCKE